MPIEAHFDVSNEVGFPIPNRLLTVLPDFPAKRVRSCHLGIQSAGKLSETGVFNVVDLIFGMSRKKPP
jgi:hypothetical protein